MAYFTELSLRHDPFSTLPQPEFFYPTQSHKDLLKKVEIAVRLRKGLSIVSGGHSFGKTSIYMELFDRLNKPGIKRETIRIYEIMDHDFSSEEGFVWFLVGMFKNIKTGKIKDIKKIKAKITKYLIKELDTLQLPVILIDDAHLLPSYCLRYLKELAEIMIGDKHAIQIVLFGDVRIFEGLDGYDEFIDMAGLHITIPLLNQIETGEMINFRIKEACCGDNPPMLFSKSAISEIFRRTSGNPGAVVALCRKSLIRSATSKQNSAGLRQVRNAALNKVVKKTDRKIAIGVWKVVRKYINIAAIIIISISMLAGLFYNRQYIYKTLINKLSSTAEASVKNQQVKYDTIKLTLNEGDILSKKLKILYSTLDPKYVRLLVAANPDLGDFSSITPGQQVNIPLIPSNINPFHPDRIYIRVQVYNTLDEVVNFVREYPSFLPEVRTLPYRTRSGETAFAIMFRDDFPSIDEANTFLSNLPNRLAMMSEAVRSWDDVSFFYKTW